MATAYSWTQLRRGRNCTPLPANRKFSSTRQGEGPSVNPMVSMPLTCVAQAQLYEEGCLLAMQSGSSRAPSFRAEQATLVQSFGARRAVSFITGSPRPHKPLHTNPDGPEWSPAAEAGGRDTPVKPWLPAMAAQLLRAPAAYPLRLRHEVGSKNLPPCCR